GPERADGRVCTAGSGAEGIICSALWAAERLRHPQSVDLPAGVCNRVIGLEIDVAPDLASRNIVALSDGTSARVQRGLHPAVVVSLRFAGRSGLWPEDRELLPRHLVVVF